jgi:DNA polymerase elongation subunit (family B)
MSLTILQNLLDARKNTRKIIKNSVCIDENCKKIAQYGLEGDKNPKHCLDHKEENEIEFISSDKVGDIKILNNVLDKRQLAYKVSANSMYGAMGVKKGYLPFMPGAMVTTFMGRTNIEIVAKTIQEKYKGELVYGDKFVSSTGSCRCVSIWLRL